MCHRAAVLRTPLSAMDANNRAWSSRRSRDRRAFVLIVTPALCSRRRIVASPRPMIAAISRVDSLSLTYIRMILEFSFMALSYDGTSSGEPRISVPPLYPSAINSLRQGNCVRPRAHRDKGGDCPPKGVPPLRRGNRARTPKAGWRGRPLFTFPRYSLAALAIAQ